MTAGAIPLQLMRYAASLMLGLLLQQLYNAVDAAIVGQFVSKDALAAVGTTSSIQNIMLGLMNGLSAGTSVVIAQYFGAHDEAMLKKAVHSVVVLTLILGAFCTAAGLAAISPLLRLMDTPEEIFPQAQGYLSICTSGYMFWFVYNMGASILRAVGDSRRPLLFLIIAALLNTLLDLLFIVRWRMGVEGAALATVISQGVSAIIVTTVLVRSSEVYRVDMRKIRLDNVSLKRILMIGLPTAFQQMLSAFSNTYVQGYINFFGADCMAGWSVHAKMDALILTPMDAVAMASATFVGQNYGARNESRLRSGVRWACVLGVSVTAVLVGLMFIYVRPVVAIFNNDPAVLKYAVRIVTLVIPFYPLCCINVVCASTLRGCGYAKVSSAIVLFSYVLFRQVYLYVVSHAGNVFEEIIFAYPAGWIISCVLHVMFYYKRVIPDNRKLLSTQTGGSVT